MAMEANLRGGMLDQPLTPITEQEARAAGIFCAKHAKSKSELRRFLEMLGLMPC